MSNPVEQIPASEESAGKWRFWNEAWSDSYGPYETEEQANEACRAYARWLNGDASAVRSGGA